MADCYLTMQSDGWLVYKAVRRCFDRRLSMKAIQKLEVGAGLATLLTALPPFFYIINHTLLREDRLTDRSPKEVLVRAFLLHILPSLMTAFGSYAHAVKKSKLGLIVLFVGGGFFILLYGAVITTGALFYTTSLTQVIFGLLLFFFPAGTILFALLSQSSSRI
jgi:hypothetical protein